VDLSLDDVETIREEIFQNECWTTLFSKERTEIISEIYVTVVLSIIVWIRMLYPSNRKNRPR
jgi:hypothetical protein